MFTRALYYPQIKLPDSAWLRRAILYWDEVDPIVPHNQVASIPPDHVYHQLKAEGLSRAIDPTGVVQSRGYEEVQEQIMGLVSEPAYLAAVPRGVYGSKIHGDKLTGFVTQGLQELGLVRSAGGDWFDFEPTTGALYMSCLAAAIAKKEGLEPLTDRSSSNSSFLSSQIEPGKGDQAFAQFVLENLIPAPREEVSVAQIVQFRNRHEEELLRFRRAVREIVESLGAAEDGDDVRRRLDAVKDDVREQSLALGRKLKESRIETIFNVLSVSLPTHLDGLAAIATLPIGAVLGGAKAVLKVGREVLNGRIRRNSLLADNAYTYVYRVEQRLG